MTLLDSATTFYFYLGDLAVTIPVAWYLPIFVVATYVLLLICMSASLYNLNLKDLSIKQAIVFTTLLFVAVNLPWYIWYAVQLT